MKKFTLSLFSMTALAVASIAQTQVADSIQTGASYANDVYYSFQTGKVKEVSNKEWQLAFSIGMFNVGIRANTATGSSGDGSVKVYEQPGKDTTKWTNFDTTGYTSWPSLDNSDENWEEGAFNRNASGSFDYGWGIYNTSTHIITGNRLYLVAFKSGTSTVFKKLWVLNKNLGNWNLKYANIDGSSPQSFQIKSSDYADRNFAYLSFVTDQVIDHEPNTNAWDILLTRYAALQVGMGVYYPSTGILTNAGVLTSEVRGVPTNTSSLADTTSVSDNISEIGADWKLLNSSFAYYTVDSLSYFVKVNDGAYWKLVFTGFVGSSAGRAIFHKTKLTTSTGVAKTTGNVKNLVLYPNPASDFVTVLFESSSNQNDISIVNMTGRTVLQQSFNGSGFQNYPLNVSSLPKGVYFLHLRNEEGAAVQKFVVQ